MKLLKKQEVLLVDGALRGAALAFCIVSLVCIFQEDLLGVLWLIFAVLSLALSWLIGWAFDIE